MPLTLEDYYRIGYSVLPLRGKIPERGVSYPTYSLHRATHEEVARWMIQYPNCNIGIATGPASHLCIIDLDDPSRWTPDMFPATTTVESRPGHWQLWYRSEKTLPRKIRILPGLDILGNSGYGIAPPSIHPDTGKPYRFISPILARLPAVPDSILDMLRQQRQPTSPQTWPSPVGGDGGSGGKGGWGSRQRVTQRGVRATLRDYADRAFREELLRLKRIPIEPGHGKDAAFNKSAFRMGQLIEGCDLPAARVFDAFLAVWCETWGKPEPTGRRTLHRAIEAGRKYPRFPKS